MYQTEIQEIEISAKIYTAEKQLYEGYISNKDITDADKVFVIKAANDINVSLQKEKEKVAKWCSLGIPWLDIPADLKEKVEGLQYIE